MTTHKITARNNNFLRACKAVFNDPIYRIMRATLNAGNDEAFARRMLPTLGVTSEPERMHAELIARRAKGNAS